jgi:Domain of unknown function (DUF4328)
MSDASGDPNFPTPPPPPPPNIAPPPGFVSYGATDQGAFSVFQRVGAVAKSLGILVMIVIGVQLVLVLLLVVARGKAQDFIDGTIDKDEFTRGVVLYGLMGVVSFAVQIAILVLTIVWMSKMARNQQALGRAGTWGPPWAIAGWFLPPCVLYVIPYLMFRDLWKSSDPQSAPDWRRNPVGPIVHIWWVLFGLLPLAFIGVTFTNFRSRGDRTDIEAAHDLVDDFGLTVLSSLVSVAAAVAFLFLVRQLTARHKETIHES